jgi:catechol 2,3-dioxygenase-like lactoylglutathione lyase family enzyme
MFSHIMLGATDIEASKAFYDATLGAIGIGPGVLNPSPYWH